MLNVLLWILILLIVPTCVGYAVCQALSIRPNAAKGYLLGSMAQWALIQLISVPLAIFRVSFAYVCISVSAVLGVTSLFGIYAFLEGLKSAKGEKRAKMQFADVFALVLMIAGFLAVAAAEVLLQHSDHDDSRFVVTAVDIVRTNRMFLTNPSTGLEITSFLGDMHRDVVSPWAVYIALTAKLTGTHATIMAHTVLPQSLMLCMLCAYWLLADTFFPQNTFARCAFVFLAFAVNVFGAYSKYTVEAFSLLRLWQGKAVVAAVGIPTLFLLFCWIYKDGAKGWRPYIPLYMTCFALCLMSGMGIIIGGIMCGCAGLAYAILQRKASIAVKTWIGAVICLMYYGVILLKW